MMSQQLFLTVFYTNRHHLVVVEGLAWAWALVWALLLEHVGEGSPAAGLHMVEDHTQEEEAVRAQELFLLFHT